MLVFPKFLYILGYALCAQNPLHSFFYQNVQLPLDARCTGTHLGFLIVFIFWLKSIKKKNYLPPSWGIISFLLLFVLYFAFDGFSSTLRASYVTNLTRFFSGLFFGQALGLFLTMVINHSLWGKIENRRKIIGWREFVVMALINLLLFSFAFFNITPFFYFAGWISIIGLVILFFTINIAFLLLVPWFSENHQYYKTKVKLIIYSILLSGIEIAGLVFLRGILTNSLI
jgi:uncharacterized membrane protein